MKGVKPLRNVLSAAPHVISLSGWSKETQLRPKTYIPAVKIRAWRRIWRRWVNEKKKTKADNS